MDHSIEAIRRRLIYLQFRAFVIMVVITMMLVVFAMVFALINSAINTPFDQLPIVSKLEGFYEGNGNSWDGVEQVIQKEGQGYSDFWLWSYLIDRNGTIIADNKSKQQNLVGTIYHSGRDDISLDININREPIGKLVFEASSLIIRLKIIGTVLTPVAAISVFLGVFLIISNYYLVRRIINPLSDTIAAAREVAAGNLKARVNVKGPDDLKGLNETFNQMVIALDETNTNRREFLADIAHELRTPITVMRGRLEGILDGIYSADENQIVPILQATYMLERLVDDLRTLTLIETRQMHFELKQVNLDQIIQNSIANFSAQAESQQVTIEFLQPLETVEAFVDQQRIQQVIDNIISNSLRYIHSSGRVGISLEKNEKISVIVISDNGPGVAEEDLPHLFDRFWRKDKSRSRRTGGSGLGLAISRQLVEAQGGTISASNHSGSGLSVRINLPACEKLGC